MNKYKLVALVPMKAHSERVKNKNFRDFCGKPFFRWIIDTMLLVDEIDLVVINTDAREILAKNGLEDSARILIRDRKPEICGDFVSMNLVIQDDIENISSDTFIMTHTTNPLLGKDTISRAIKEFKVKSSDGEFDSLFTVSRYQSRFYSNDGSPINHDPNNLIRTQDLDPLLEENSNIYIFSNNSFQQTNARIGLRPIMFEVPKLESIDVDEQIDWDLAMLIAKANLLNQFSAEGSS